MKEEYANENDDDGEEVRKEFLKTFRFDWITGYLVILY